MRAPLLALAAGTLLTACAAGGGSKASMVPTAIATPFCAGDYQAAASSLETAGRDDGASRFYKAYLTELSGHGARARPLYAAVITGGDRDRVTLSCKGGPAIPANEAAASRLTAIALELRSMDAATDAPFRLHEGLPETRPVRAEKAATPAPAMKPKPPAQQTAPRKASSAPVTLEAPTSHDPQGRWFAHLVSYFDGAEATGSLGQLGRRYPALAGMFDTMQVVAKGRDAWRVGVRANDWADADRLCVAIRASGDYCRVIDTAN